MSLWKWLGDHKDSINTWTDAASHVAVVASLVIGGLWTYRLFVLKEAPALEVNGQLDTDLRWTESREKGYCWANLHSDLKNKGISPFRVTNVRISGWYNKLKLSSENGGLQAPIEGYPTI